MVSDSLGNSIKVDKFKTVRCDFYQFTQFKSAQVTGVVNFIDLRKQQKINQARNYIKQANLQIASDSIDLIASKANYEIAEKQLHRSENLFNDGLKSLTDLETKKLKLQETKAKYI